MWCNYRFVAHICLNICPGLRDPNDEKLRFRGTFTYVHAQQRNRGTAVLRRTQLTAILYHGNTAVQIPDKQTAGKPEKKTVETFPGRHLQALVAREFVMMTLWGK